MSTATAGFADALGILENLPAEAEHRREKVKRDTAADLMRELRCK